MAGILESNDEVEECRIVKVKWKRWMRGWCVSGVVRNKQLWKWSWRKV